MRVLPYVASGVGFVVFLPFATMMVAFAHDSPNASPREEILRAALVLTLVAIPLVWVGSLISSLIIARRKVDIDDLEGTDIVEVFTVRKAEQRKKDRLLKFCALSPYFAAALHLSVWIIAFALPK
jgi:hypothetical protein